MKIVLDLSLNEKGARGGGTIRQEALTRERLLLFPDSFVSLPDAACLPGFLDHVPSCLHQFSVLGQREGCARFHLRELLCQT